MDTRTALLDSAEKACRSRGFDGFSYADLSAEVGIRKASIHHHFPTKADLALAVIERYSDMFFTRLNAVSADGGTAGSHLKAYIDTYRGALRGGDTVCLCVAFSAGRDSLSEPVLGALNMFHESSFQWLSKVFEAGASDGSIRAVGDPAFEAKACLAIVEGAQLMARAASDVSLFEAATQSLAARVLDTSVT